MATNEDVEETSLLLASNDIIPRSPVSLKLSHASHVELLVFLTAVTFTFGEYLQPAPRLEIVERIICRQYYSRIENVIATRQDCKSLGVQDELAFIKGIEGLCGLLPSLVAIPYGILAKRYGNRRILCLGLLGCALGNTWSLIVCWFSSYLPIRLLWASFAFQFIGGGTAVVITMIYLIVSDAVSDESRMNSFLRFHAGTIISAVIAPILASFLMSFNLWLPWFIGQGCSFGGVLIALLIPQMSSMPSSMSVEHQGLLNIDDEEEGEPQKARVHVQEAILSGFMFLRETAILIILDVQVLLLLVVSLLARLGFESLSSMSLLYISKRYHWTYAQAGLLSSLGAAIQIVMLLLILPMTNKVLLHSLHFSIQGTGKIIILSALATTAIGAFCLGLASNIYFAISAIAVMSMGAGADTMIRSLLTSVVKEKDLNVVYSVMSILMTIGTAIAGPIYSAEYSAGLRLGIGWYGLLYLSAGATAGLAFILMLFVKEKRVATVDDEYIDHGM